VAQAEPLFLARLAEANRSATLDVAGFAGSIQPSIGIAQLAAHPDASPADLLIWVRTVLALYALEQEGLLFHAAGVLHRGQGYALFGRSGSGKTTTARNAAPGDLVLNDDLILLAPQQGAWQIWATPFGQRPFAPAPPAPLRALLYLVQAEENRLAPLGAGQALGELVANSPVVNGLPGWLPALLSRWQAVLDQVPVRALYLRASPAFWEVIDAEFG
jgi:hypothetical protein